MIYGSMIGVTLALAATTASAGRSYEDMVKDIPVGDGDGDGETTITFTEKSGSNRTGGSIRCTSKGWASTFSESKDSYIAAEVNGSVSQWGAVENVVADVCDPEWCGSAISATETLRDWASAYAEAAASATAECSSQVSGGATARGCAYSEAYASAAARSFAEVHAKASADAFAKHCSCANAEDWSFGEADLFKELWATANADASAKACASGDPGATIQGCTQGNAHSEASAYVHCYSEIIAETFAFAAARASAAAGCYYGYQDADVRTEIEATVDALVNNYETCTIIEDKEGLGDSSGNGGTTSGSSPN